MAPTASDGQVLAGEPLGLEAGSSKVAPGLVVDITASSTEDVKTEAVDRFKPHPSQAAAAPARAAFAKAGPVIVTGDPRLQGIQVRGAPP